MKPNFAAQQTKVAKKKKQKLAKKLKAKAAAAATGQEPGGDDVTMDDAPMVDDEPTRVEDAEEMEDAPVLSARDKHHKAVMLKRSLKAKVQDLKKTRQKVTKMGNSKGARRQLTDEIKTLSKAMPAK